MMAGIRTIHKSRKLKSRIFGVLCLCAVLIAAGVLAILLWSVARDGVARLRPEFFSNFTSRIPEKAGIKAALFGSLWIVGLTAIISVPVGVAAAIYLEEFTTRKTRVTEFIQVNIANLAGVPSIVYGLLGLALFVRQLALGRSVLAGALTMSLLILPTIIIVAQEAFKAVPRSYRDGSYALGATRWQTIRSQVLPAAMPGVLTGIILSLSRALGETAPLITIGAATFIAATPSNLSDRFTVLPLQIFNWSSAPQKGFHEAASAAVVVLLGSLLVLNSAAIWLRHRQRSR